MDRTDLSARFRAEESCVPAGGDNAIMLQYWLTTRVDEVLCFSVLLRTLKLETLRRAHVLRARHPPHGPQLA